MTEEDEGMMGTVEWVERTEQPNRGEQNLNLRWSVNQHLLNHVAGCGVKEQAYEGREKQYAKNFDDSPLVILPQDVLERFERAQTPQSRRSASLLITMLQQNLQAKTKEKRWWREKKSRLKAQAGGCASEISVGSRTTGPKSQGG
ncbi:hypothetical protein Bbelb_229160 [Branchiostoma belcheri]|nr:hypothetical protein Bbelb_229160 [Branchiostoma belcheri]